MKVEILSWKLIIYSNIQAVHYTTTIPVILIQFHCIQEISATEFSRFQ